MKLQSHRMIKASRNLQEFLAQEGNWIRIMKLSSTSQVRRIKYPLPSVPIIKLQQLSNSISKFPDKKVLLLLFHGCSGRTTNLGKRTSKHSQHLKTAFPQLRLRSKDRHKPCVFLKDMMACL